MWRRMIGLSLILAVCMAGSVFAADDDYVMGNYEGTLSGKAWEGKTLRAQVVTQPGHRWRAVLWVGENRDQIKGMERPGTKGDEKAEGRAAALRKMVVDFAGGAELGVPCLVTGEITNETFTGVLDGKDGKGEFVLKRVFIQPPSLGQAPPAGATVLLGQGNMDAWNVQPHWILDGDNMHISGSSIVSKQEFGSAQYHIEFMCPFMPEELGQGRGNSGCYIMGRYEVQVLDSFGDLPADNLCGGIYKEATPIVCASLPPLQWQTYDITFTAPKYDAAGKKTANARITVVHNGITIHDDVELANVTPGGISGEEALMGPLMIQDHGDVPRFRNIWVKSL